MATTKSDSKLPHIQERQNFRTLLAANPNHFGNLKDSKLKAVLNIQSNTTYEEIGCVGFQPQFTLLEAVIFVKESSGYGGAICSQGTPEYVRFYLSTDNGATWQDEGLTSFTAFNIPFNLEGEKRLEYAVTLPIKPRKKVCSRTNIALVRAILSWDAPPPPNTPDFIPVWGDIHNTHIQIAPLKLIPIKDLLDEIKLPKDFSEIIDLEKPLPLLEPKAHSTAELQTLYKGKQVEPHRFALKDLDTHLNRLEVHESLFATQTNNIFSELKLDLADLSANLVATQGSTRYEELECVGLQPSYGGTDILVGTLRVKLPVGYSGTPCTAGSKEYVAFWADFNNNGTFETYLGTTSVNVYDIQEVPKEGLEYAVFLPVNLNKYRQLCSKGPVVVRLRAILSWEVAPPSNNPNYVPVWGNREDTFIHIYPGTPANPNTHPPVIEAVGSMATSKINNANGFANGTSTLGFAAYDSPFGGLVRIDGHIANSTDISNGATPLKYRILIRPNGAASWQRLTNTFSISRTQLLNGSWSNLPDVVQSVDANDFYLYREDLIGGPGDAQIFVTNNVLGYWQTSGLSGLWQIRVEVLDPANNTFFSSIVTICLDNEAPQFPAGTFKITSGGGSCADFMIGDVIEGTYQVTEQHFNSLSFSLLPSMGGTFTAPVPLPRTYPTVSTNGEAGTWKLDTTGLPKCGYVVRLSATDRTIVNSGGIGFYNETSVGLCLRKP